MTDDDGILKELGARARERAREEEADSGLFEGIPAFDATAEDRIATRLLARPARPRRWLTTVTPIVALAAGIALFVTVRGPSGKSLPAYELSVVSASQVRAPQPNANANANANEFTVDPDGELQIVARPAAPLHGLLAEAIVIRSGDAKPWIVPIDISEDGALRIEGATRTLFPASIGGVTGSYDIAIIVAGADALPSEPDAIAIAKAPSIPTQTLKFRVIRARIRFVEKK